MTNTTLDITIQFRAGADIPDEAYRFRQVFINNDIEVTEEKYTKNSVTYTVECTLASFGFIDSQLKDKSLDVDEAIVEITYEQPQTMIPVVGTVQA